MLLKLEGHRLPKLFGPLLSEKVGGSTILLLWSEPKTGGAWALPAHSKTTPLQCKDLSVFFHRLDTNTCLCTLVGGNGLGSLPRGRVGIREGGLNMR